MAGKRKTTEEMIVFLEEKIKTLREKNELKQPRSLVLTKKSEGMEQLIAGLVNVAKQHKTTVAEIIKAIVRIKKTGLKIENADQISRKPENKVS
ncbi:MAG: hypothetical protein ABIR84_01760 [Candidatus Nitrotoga sp.]